MTCTRTDSHPGHLAGGPCHGVPEPAAQPAEQPHTASAAAGPYPGTPDGAAGVLGRALLDGTGDVWPNDGDGLQAASENPPVREVLLVSPAAGRVIETAVAARLAERNADDPGGWGRWQDAIEAHHAAVDALDADQPAECGNPNCRGGCGPENRTNPDSGGSLASSGRWPEPVPEPADCEVCGRDDLAQTDPPRCNRHATGPTLADDCLRTAAQVRAIGETNRCRFCGYPAGAHPGDLRLEGKQPPEPDSGPALRYRAEEERDAARAELAEVTTRALAMRTDIDAARRDAAADVLVLGAELIRTTWSGTCANPDTCAGSLDSLARGIRAGTRPVPGSPQPARDEQEQIELEALRRCPVPGSLETPGSPQPAEGGGDGAG